MPRAAPSMKPEISWDGTRDSERGTRVHWLIRVPCPVSPVPALGPLHVPVEDPLAAVAVDDLAAGLEGLHRGGSDLHVTGGAGDCRTTSTTASPRFFSIRRRNSARSRGGIAGLEPVDLLLGARQLVVDRAAARRRQSFSRSSCCSVSAGRISSRPSSSVVAVLDLFLEAQDPVLGRADRASRRRRSRSRRRSTRGWIWTLRSCDWYFLRRSRWSASSPFGPAALELRLRVSRALSAIDGLDLLLVLAVDLDELGRDGVAFPSRALHEPEPVLEPVELLERRSLHRGAPVSVSRDEKGCSGCGTPFGFSLASFVSVSDRPSPQSSSALFKSQLVGPPGFEPGSDRL